MGTMKKFFKYFVWFLIIYFLVSILSFNIIKSSYKTKNCIINFSNPNVEIVEAKATVTNGYVKGKITNNTEDAILNKVLKLDCISPRGVIMGTKYVDIGNLAPGAIKNFESKFNFDNVKDISISLLDKTDIPNLKDLDFEWDDLKLNKTSFGLIAFAVFIFFGENIVMLIPFI